MMRERERERERERDDKTLMSERWKKKNELKQEDHVMFNCFHY